jgi:hypothetical protein
MKTDATETAVLPTTDSRAKILNQSILDVTQQYIK